MNVDLKSIFPKRKKTIENITIDELRLARVKLDQEQERIMRKVTELEEEKERLFQQGVAESSQRRQQLLAQKVQEVEMQARSYDKTLAGFQKQMRVLNGMISLKENSQSWQQTAVGEILGSMDMGELETFIDQATANNVFQMDKFEQLLGSLEENEDIAGAPKMDDDVAEIMAAMQRAREAGTAGANLDSLAQSLSSENEK
jgi:hypothetical protein